MFDSFESFQVQTQSLPEVFIHGIKSQSTTPNLPTLLLLHGFPQNYRIWHRVVSQLINDYNIIAIDLRGYGKSSKPTDVAEYAKSKMAQDCHRVLARFNISKTFVCAHDRGARVAHKLCVDFPHLVEKAIFLDIAPTLAMYTNTDLEFARRYFHWFFLIQKAPLPENAIAANPREFARNFMGSRQAGGLGIFEATCFESYVDGLGDAATIHGMCQDYRASASLDLDEARADLGAGRRLQCPLLVLWAEHGVIETCFDAVKEWQDVAAADVEVKGHSVDSGHYIPEQASGEVVAAILDFLQ